MNAAPTREEQSGLPIGEPVLGLRRSATHDPARLANPGSSSSTSSLPLKPLRAPLLFPVSLCDLPDEDRKWHGKRSVDRTGIGPAVVLEDCDSQSGIVGQDDSCLLHPHESGLTLGLT